MRQLESHAERVTGSEIRIPPPERRAAQPRHPAAEEAPLHAEERLRLPRAVHTDLLTLIVKAADMIEAHRDRSSWHDQLAEQLALLLQGDGGVLPEIPRRPQEACLGPAWQRAIHHPSPHPPADVVVVRGSERRDAQGTGLGLHVEADCVALSAWMQPEREEAIGVAELEQAGTKPVRIDRILIGETEQAGDFPRRLRRGVAHRDTAQRGRLGAPRHLAPGRALEAREHRVRRQPAPDDQGIDVARREVETPIACHVGPDVDVIRPQRIERLLEEIAQHPLGECDGREEIE